VNPLESSDASPTGAISAVGEVIRQRYRVEQVLGRGGMGEVLLAHDALLNRRVALKRLRPSGDEDASRRSAILKEARRASQVADRRIAAIYDVLEVDADVLIVMEYVEGQTLRTRIESPLPLTEFWNLATQCVEAVGAAHARGIIHRDIKPENLMVTVEGQIKILDFGIARRPDAPEGEAIGPATTMTAEGRGLVIAGTPQYMAPEAHYGGRIDARTDIFSLGTVFYELLTAQHPFAAPTYQAVLERVMTHDPLPVGDVNAAVGSALSGVISRMMAKDPAHRHASCEALLGDLAAARGQTGAPPGAEAVWPSSRQERRRHTRTAAVIAALAVALGLLGWTLLRWAPSLPRDRNVAILPPTAVGTSDEFASFALGAIDLLSQRLQKQQMQPGFQIAPFGAGVDEHVRTAVDARRVLGVNLALIPALEQRSDVFRGRLELWNTGREAIVASRVIEAPVSQPFQFLDRLYKEATGMLALTASPTDIRSEVGVRGAGTLSFLVRGIGRLRAATTQAESQRAVDELELARRAEPNASVAWAWLAAAQRRCFSITNDPAWLDRAEASAREAVARDSSRAESFRYLGMTLVSKKDDAGALAAFARACSLNATDDDSYSRLGASHGRLGQHDLEIATYRSVIARRPHCWQPYWWLANACFRRGQAEEAILAYRQMIRHAPEFYRGYSNLGGLLALRGDYSAAIDTLRRSLALRPTKNAFDNLGTACFTSGRIQEAVDAYNQALQFGFAEYDAWLNLGDAYFFLNDRRDQAAQAYAQATRLGREQMTDRAAHGRSFDVMIPAYLSTVFPKLGQPDSARAYLRQALAADSANAMVQCCAALTCWQLSERDQAVRWLDRAVHNGYPVAWLRDSPVFREWNAREDFRALLAQSSVGPSTSVSP
jgi:eukaryotic-like serine/threonine-protein kinase